jgi:hypothetical protein
MNGLAVFVGWVLKPTRATGKQHRAGSSRRVGFSPPLPHSNHAHGGLKPTLQSAGALA